MAAARVSNFSMKTMFAIFAAITAAVSTVAFAADEPGKCCDKPKPEPTASCCCCAKAQKAAASPTLEQLVATAKDAKGDQLLEALGALINKLIEERKGMQPSPAPGAAPQGHQH